MAETEITRIINIKTGEGINSVRDLKKYIGELRDSLVVLDKDTDEYKKTVDELTDKQKKLTEVQAAGKSTYTAVEDSIKGLRLQLKSLNNTYDELSAADRNSDIGKNLLTQIQAVDKQLKELEGSTGRFQRNVGNYKSALDGLNQSYVAQKTELRELKVALEQLEPGTEAYNQAFIRAAEITHNLTEQQEMLKYSSADLGDQLSNLRGIASNMAAGYSAVNAALGLFGKENEDVARALLKVQQAMALVQGLQGLDGLLKRTKGLSTAMKTWLTTSQQVTTATKAQTVATNAQTVATNTATVATKGLNAALKANPIGAIITAVLLLTSLIKPLTKLFDNLTGKTKRVKEETKQAELTFQELDTRIAELDKQNRLELIRMRLEGISELEINIRRIGKAEDIVNEVLESTNIQVDKVEKLWKKATNSNEIYTKQLLHMGYTQEQVNDLIEQTTLNIKEVEKTQNLWGKYTDIKIQMDYLLRYIEMLKEAKRTLKEIKDSQEEDELNKAVQVAESAKEAMMSETALLKKRYEENKALLEKYHIDTKDLTAKYYKDLKELANKNKLEPINWDFTAGNFESIKKQMDEFFNTYKKNSLELLEYQRDNTIKTLNDAKEEEYKYFQDLFDKGRITAEQLANEKKEIDEKYYAVKMQVDEKYRIDYKAEEEKLLEELQQKRKESFLKDVEDAKTYTDAKIRAIKNKYDRETQTGNWWKLLTPVTPEEERAYMDEIYNAQLEGLTKIKSLWEQRKNDESLSYEERIEAERNYSLAVMDIEDAQLEYEMIIDDKRKDLINKYLRMTEEAIGQIGNLFGSLADIYEEDIKAKQKAGKMSDKEADRAFESVKGMRVAETVMNTLAGSIGAFLNASEAYPPPYGQIIGGVAAAAVAASGIAQIAKIKSTTRDGGGSSAASSASVPAPDTSYDYQPMYVSNTTGQQDTEYLRNSLTEQPIRAYVVESDITESQNRTKKRQNESDF